LKVFLSSTFLDLSKEREAVLAALRRKRMATLAMEDFLATTSTPLDTALENLRDSDLMILVIGSKAGSLLSDGSGRTYTSAEYDELLKLGKEALVFVKQQKRWPWSRHRTWRNAEWDPKKRKALDDFKARVGAKWTWDIFSTPDQLALGVIQALDRWEARGRPGSRRTFSSAAEYFAGKNPAGHFQLLDFGTTLLGRENELGLLREFLDDGFKRICILSGRGGIGKSKILHDFANSSPETTIFLKDEPLWHEDSEKEIPVDAQTLVVDDAHRQESLGKVLQLVHERFIQRPLKLIVSTRPGSATRLAQQIHRKFDAAEVTALPELKELTREQSRSLAEQVLGQQFRAFSEHLAQLGTNSPLVIVAGGRLIATQKVDPSALTTLDEFRSTIFSRFLDEMELHGPKFAIDPPLPVLQLLAALGPIDVEAREFQRSAQQLLNRRADETLSTIDALASHGIITPRPKPVRVIPDVLSDYVLEQRCIGNGNRSTGYADRVYEHFGAHSLKVLMRNLAELDWRIGRTDESGLNLLEGIWADIHQRFRAGDEYERHRILVDLSGTAIYQPDHVLALVRTAIEEPISIGESTEGSRFRLGPEHVLEAVPDLLEATAHHPARLTESVNILWELAQRTSNRSNVAKSAQGVLKRLASWHRFGHPALNFAMLLQAIRIAQRPDAFEREYTPFALIEPILEREGEFREWQDDTTISFGGFGLNYAGVGAIRENTLDYLETLLSG
jgi:hypothetical protein